MVYRPKKTALLPRARIRFAFVQMPVRPTRPECRALATAVSQAVGMIALGALTAAASVIAVSGLRTTT